MLWKSIKETIKITVRSRETMIWTVLFPLVMALLFYAAFSSLDISSALEPISVALVEDEASGQCPGLVQLLQELSEAEEGEKALLSLQSYADRQTCLQLLEDGDVCGVIAVQEGEPVLTVKEEGLEQTILRQILTQYRQTFAAVKSASSPQEAAQALELAGSQMVIRQVSLTRSNPSEMVNYFYSLLAMVCLFGMFQGVTAAYNLQANQSALGARRCIAPRRYASELLGNVLGSAIVHLASVWFSLAFMALVLKISFGGRLLWAALGCLAGSLTGISLGLFLGSFPKLGLQAKIGLSVAVSLLLCFLSGMMMGGLNYWIHQHVPFLSWINPASRLVDALHSLYYYDSLEPFFLNTGILFVFCAAFFILAALRLRRYQYESI